MKFLMDAFPQMANTLSPQLQAELSKSTHKTHFKLTKPLQFHSPFILIMFLDLKMEWNSTMMKTTYQNSKIFME